jgi:phage tail sheath protein FI
MGVGYKFGAVVLCHRSAPAGSVGTIVVPIYAAQAFDDATDFSFSDFKAAYELANSGQTITPLALIYAVGPGVYANTELKLGVVSTNLVAPTGLALTVSAGGSLTASTAYSYIIRPINANGEGPASASVVASTTVANKTISGTFNAVAGAVGYAVYKGTAGSEVRWIELPLGTTSFTDDGSITPSAVPVTQYTTASSEQFELQVFDLLQSSQVPVERIGVTLREYIDGFNNNLEIETLTNDASSYIRVRSNVATAYPFPATLPTITTATAAAFAEGSDGSAPSITDVQLAWAAFKNKDVVRVNMLVDAGWANPIVAAAMREVADIQRAHFINDVPYSKQSGVSAVSYRQNQLNQNTRRGSLFVPWLRGVDGTTSGVRDYPGSVYAAQRMVFTDTLFSPGRSAAGLNRGVTDALDLSKTTYRYDDSTRDLLVQSQVNYFRVRRGVGVVMWEQRTLQSQFSAASFISVSRIWDVIQNSIEEFLEYELQEPNDDFFAKQIKSALELYLGEQVIQRNLEAFEVVIDERAGNTPSVLSQGQRNVDVYLTPTLPANRIRCRTILTRQGVQFADIVLA